MRFGSMKQRPFLRFVVEDQGEGGGESEPAGNGDTDSAGSEDDAVNEGESSLGDPGKKALDRMKQERNQAKQDARALKEQLDALQAKIDGREKEFQAERQRAAFESEALAKANSRIVNAEIRAAAASKLADPNDALRFIDVSEFEVGEDGSVDTEAISDALSELLEKKPYLAAQGGNKDSSFVSPGAHRKDSKSQLTRAEIERMSPKEIVQARAEGRLDNVLGIS